MIHPPGHRPSGRRLTRALLVSALGLVVSVAPAGLAPSLSTAAVAAPAVPGSSVLTPAQVQAQQWWILRLNLRKAWQITRGRGVTVAVMDTGVDPNFADLRGALVQGFGVDTHATGDTDSAYHGTRIADEIAGRGTGFGLLGIAPQAKIMPIIVPGSAGSAAVAAALDHLAAMSRPPQVVNMSFGGPFPCSSSLAAAVRTAVRAGMVLVAGAGNSGQTGNLSQYPANCPGVVAVGAVNTNGGVWSDSQRRAYVTLSDPGVHMIGYDATAKSGYGYADGTSDAAAMASGIVALLRSHSPSMSGRDVVTRLLATASQFGGKAGTRNDRYGFGVGLPYKALTGRVPAGSPNPVYAGLTSTSSPSSGAGSSTAPSGTSSGSPAPTGSGATHAGDRSGGTNVGLVAAVVIIVLVVLGIVVAVTLRGRRRAVDGAGR